MEEKRQKMLALESQRQMTITQNTDNNNTQTHVGGQIVHVSVNFRLPHTPYVNVYVNPNLVKFSLVYIFILVFYMLICISLFGMIPHKECIEFNSWI